MFHKVKCHNAYMFFIVDEEDLEFALKYKWTLTKDGYALSGKVGLFHRCVMGLKKGDKKLIDHISGNKLDNRKVNLRICSHKQNMRNRKKSWSASGYKGSSYLNGKYVSHIAVDGETKYLGSFETPEGAAKAYDEAAKKYHGEFAGLNFPED